MTRGRPRSAGIPEETRHCPEHGMTTFRRFRNGKSKTGKQQYIWVCLISHNERNKANLARAKENT